MKRALSITLAGATLVSGVLGILVQPVPDPIAYKLQERCGHDVATFVKTLQPGTGERDPNIPVSYTAHYNTATNACFALVDVWTKVSDELETLAALVPALAELRIVLI